jgi:hypothetical protein
MQQPKQEPVMSKRSTDPSVSPLLLLVPLPFILATCLPLNLDPSRAMYKADRVATVSHDGQRGEQAASAPRSGDAARSAR